MNQPDVFADDLKPRLNERLGRYRAPKIWRFLKTAIIGEAPHTDVQSINEYIRESCDLTRQRFTECLIRAHAGKSITDLVSFLDEAKGVRSSFNAWKDDVQYQTYQSRRKDLTSR